MSSGNDYRRLDSRVGGLPETAIVERVEVLAPDASGQLDEPEEAPDE